MKKRCYSNKHHRNLTAKGTSALKIFGYSRYHYLWFVAKPTSRYAPFSGDALLLDRRYQPRTRYINHQNFTRTLYSRIFTIMHYLIAVLRRCAFTIIQPGA